MKGGAREGSGRKSKAEEMKLVERLSPLEPKAHEKLNEAIDSGKEWAIKLFFDYMYGKPKQMIEQTNVNLDAGKLTAEEAKMINEQLDQSY
jgi:hypothetical protein